MDCLGTIMDTGHAFDSRRGCERDCRADEVERAFAELREEPSGSWKNAQAMLAADQTADWVIQITATAMPVCYSQHEEGGAMASIHSYEGWWDLSLIDTRNERPLLSAFLAVLAIWGTTFLLALL